MMTDRAKFKVFEMDEQGSAIRNSNANQAITKQEAAANPMDGEKLMTDIDERFGRPIRVGVFISKLQRLNPAIRFELSTGDVTKYGVYVLDSSANRGLRFICGMESGINFGGRINEGVMPEFSIIETEDIIVPDGNTIRKDKKFVRELRGWRTVLAALYQSRLLTEAQIERTFKISEGKSSSNWKNKVNPTIHAN